MLTEFGKKVRILRLEKNESLRSMAEKLDVSATFLSAVEHGKKNIPTHWIAKLSELYQIDEEQEKIIRDAFLDEKENVTIRVSGMSREKKQLAISFSDNLALLDKESEEKIQAVFDENSKK